MPYAVQLYIDSATDTTVRKLWDKIAQAGLSSYMPDSGVRPHVSIAVYDEIDRDIFQSKLRQFADAIAPFPFTLGSIGSFPTEEGVVFLAPIVTEELLAIHSRFHQAFSRYRQHASDYYIPGRWVPHCTVTMDLKSDEISKGVDVCRQILLPVSGKFESIGIIEFFPVKDLFGFDLKG